ncbi:dioxygenase family protein [Fluviispira vulneris]|uniref:dioxygenase family protein n=1 Tax=Fluviispira vulneris TaxID=2763012 RepID=UPI001645118E|nr:class III extradiol ring-cleavage dioxygenase [Fluviispira vulneris]
MQKQPVLFIGHGSPRNAIDESGFSKALKEYGRSLRLNTPKVILCVSAHWFVDRFFIAKNENSDIIYDFFGFNEDLSQFKYKYKGSKIWAQKIKEVFQTEPLEYDEERGIDHGVWSVLAHLFPDADVPVVQMSMNRKFSIEEHYRFYAKLKPLRNEGVLMIGSGNIVHSFAGLREEIDAKPYDWAYDFDAKIKKCILNNSIEELLHYEAFGDCARRAVPTIEHYLPLIFSMSLKEESDRILFIYEGFQYSTMSMLSFAIADGLKNF